MINAILGEKGKMSQTFVGGTRVPITVVKVTPNIVTQVKSEEKDGYWAVQLGTGEKRIKNVTKPMQGHLKGAIKDKKAPRFVKEIRFEEKPDLKVGDVVKISDVFNAGDVVAVTGTSKGKGFAGVVKRWGFAGGPRTHGQSDRLRAPGSIGQGTTPGRVRKGKKMAGRMGNETVTVKNLRITKVDDEENQLIISGAVPGVPGGLLIIKKLKAGKLTDLVEEAPEVEEQKEEPEGEKAEGEKPQEKKEEVKEEKQEEKTNE